LRILKYNLEAEVSFEDGKQSDFDLL